ncbi:MAG: hypothetical protein B6I31_01340 [Desulfobacteraceae bacterium 4572_19]|nr:MAG: hypothetical protein B6I31_01340 [Desulfobacteraceae bacterium 4572_19]
MRVSKNYISKTFIFSLWRTAHHGKLFLVKEIINIVHENSKTQSGKNSKNSPAVINYFLNPGYLFVTEKPTAISTVVGSCVAVCLFDKKRRTGGMNHFQLPDTYDKTKTTTRYGNVATSMLIKIMVEDGSKTKHLHAQIFGGAYNPKISQTNIGIDNIKIARKILNKNHIKIVSEDIGGSIGRKIIFNTSSNEIAVLKVENIRDADWYPFEKNDR